MRRGLSTPAVTAAFVSTLLLLGIVGFFAGYVAAGSEIERQGQIDPTTSTSASKPPATASPSPARPSASPTPSATPPVTPTRTDAFAMPNLVNKDFKAARALAREKKLGVDIVFNEPSRKPDGTVEKTLPEAGIWVWPGLTIHLHVAGGPPVVFVPEVVDKPCDEAKDIILEAGLQIAGYPGGQRGKVTKSEPAPGTVLRWNDGVKLYCSA